MKHLLKKSEMARLLAVAITAFACMGMWGCSDRVEFKWVGRGNMSIAGFIDDSLVVAYDCRGWLETTETWNGGYSEDEGCGHDRLLVYNYRVQEDGPRWSDSLTNKSGGYRWYQLTDSIFWRWEGYNILLWKLGETAHEMKVSRKNEGCSQEFEINRIHQWLDDGFIALGGRFSAGGDSCQYAVLDTISGILTYKRLDKDLEWIEICDDVRAFGGDIYCLVLDRELFDVLLLINSDVKNTLLKDDFQLNRYATISFIGNYMNIFQSLCFLEKEQIKWLTNFSSEKVSFGDGKGNYITYEN